MVTICVRGYTVYLPLYSRELVEYRSWNWRSHALSGTTDEVGPDGSPDDDGVVVVIGGVAGLDTSGELLMLALDVIVVLASPSDILTETVVQFSTAKQIQVQFSSGQISQIIPGRIGTT